MIATLLQEMDGVAACRDVIVVAATNRPDKIDAALMRPGRFDAHVYVPNPDRCPFRSSFSLSPQSEVD